MVKKHEEYQICTSEDLNYSYHPPLINREPISKTFSIFDHGVLSKELFKRKLEPELGKAD